MASAITRRFKKIARKGSTKGYDKYLFAGEEAEQLYNDYYGTKVLCAERSLSLNDEELYKLDLVGELRRRGWEVFLSQHGPACEELVREFYANIQRIDFHPNGPHIFSKLRGKQVMFGPAEFSSILQLPIVEHTDYHYGQTQYDKQSMVPLISETNSPWVRSTYPQAELNDEYRMLHLVTCSTLIPQKRTTDVSIDRASLMVAIMSRKSIDARTLIGEVIDSHRNKSHLAGALPFGTFITNCARRHHIRIERGEKMVDPEGPIDGNTLRRSKSQKKKRKKVPQTGESSGSTDLMEMMNNLQISHELESEASEEWRETQRRSFETFQGDRRGMMQSHRHSIDVVQSDIHSMRQTQQQMWERMQRQWSSYPAPPGSYPTPPQ